jgi:hypothetical protein
MLDLAAIPQAVICSILGAMSGWLVLWLTTRRFNHVGALTIMDMGSNSTNLYIDVAGDL